MSETGQRPKPGAGLYAGPTEGSFRPVEAPKVAKPENKKEEDAPYQNPFAAGAEAAAAMVAGAVANELVGKLKRTLKETDTFSGLDFSEIEKRYFDEKTPSDEKEKLGLERLKRIEDFKKVDDGDMFEGLKRGVERVLRNNDWDDVYVGLNSYASAAEAEMQGRKDVPDNLNGIINYGVRYEAARLLGIALTERRRNLGQGDFKTWLEHKQAQYPPGEIVRLQKIAERHFLDLLPDMPQEFVGKDVRKDEIIGVVQPTPQVERDGREQKPRPAPEYLGAVFVDGKNQVLVEDPTMISLLDVGNPNDRDTFILLNLDAFNNRYLKQAKISPGWVSAVKDWVADFKYSLLKQSRLNRGVPVLERQEVADFENKIRAMMAVTAGARAMEFSGGSWGSYLGALIGKDERGNPPTDWQDHEVQHLLHADPAKLNLVINDPKVRPFYEKLMTDAGLNFGGYYQWREFKNDLGKTVQMPSVVSFNIRKTPGLSPEASERERQAEMDRVRNLPLSNYLKNDGEKGGFTGYIEDVLLADQRLLPDMSMEERRAAARLAADAFLVDLYTRWSVSITDNGKFNLKYEPDKGWAGDPFLTTLQPTFLPRLKGVYKERPDILDEIDLAFRPQVFIDEFKKRVEDKYGPQDFPPTLRTVLGSGVTNLKTLQRYNKALDTVLGGPMGASIANVTGRMLQEDMKPVFELFDQFYGGMSVDVTDQQGGKIKMNVGKHIAPMSSALILDAKSTAAVLSSREPGAKDLIKVVMDPESRTRSFGDARVALWGPDGTGSEGLIESLSGPQFGWMIGKKNIFGADKIFARVFDKLTTNSLNPNVANYLPGAGFVYDILRSLTPQPAKRK